MAPPTSKSKDGAALTKRGTIKITSKEKLLQELSFATLKPKG